MGEEETCVAMPENNGYSSKSLDPIPVLRESVSFGRYASESLDWGKWSSFCQNRYLEEAEKYSTRGSVAQKKAHFEAHYKRIAAKKAAALLEQQNAENASEIDNGRCEKKQFHIPDADFHFTKSIDHLTSHDEECVPAEPHNGRCEKKQFHIPDADFHFTDSIDQLTSHDEECVSAEPPNGRCKKKQFHIPDADFHFTESIDQLTSHDEECVSAEPPNGRCEKKQFHIPDADFHFTESIDQLTSHDEECVFAKPPNGRCEKKQFHIPDVDFHFTESIDHLTRHDEECVSAEPHNGTCEKKQFHIPDADFHFTESIDHLTSHDEQCVSAEPPNDEVKVEFHLPEAKGNGVTRDACMIKDTRFLSPITSLEDKIQSSPAEGGGPISIGNYKKNDHHTNERSATARVSKPRELLEIFDNENKDIQVEHKRDSNWKKSPLKDNCTVNQEISASSDTKRKSIFLNSSFLKRTSKAFPSSPETRTLTSCNKENTPIYTRKTSAKHVKDDKRSTRKNPQMIQSSYQKGEKSHPISKPSPPIEKVRNAGSGFSCFKSLDISNSLRTPTKHSANRRSKVVQALTSPEKRRKKHLEGGNSESSTSDVDQLLIPVSGKSTEITYRKSTTSYSTSTFCFWSKERAEKRKEFILNLEEKLNAQRLERQAKDKEKVENEFKLVRQSLGFKARDDAGLKFLPQKITG